MKQIECEGLKFMTREFSSDEKTIKEVVGRGVYEKKAFKIEAGETWLDLGGNIGAFAVLAAARGANVKVYEPDPFNCGMIKRNLELNGLKAEVNQVAVVADGRESAVLNLWPEGQSWRNSIVRNKRGTMPLKVTCVNFWKLIEAGHCVKMDIEGSEIEILTAWRGDERLKKLVFEWSFDVDQRVATLRAALARLKVGFTNVKYTSQVDRIDEWKFFPPATMVHCWE